jgi:phenylacetate-CoA ligase
MSIEDILYNGLAYYEKSPNFLRCFIAKTYNCIPKTMRIGSAYFYFKDLIKKTQFLSKEKLFDFQNQEFLKTISWAKQTSFYPEYYRRHGVDINSINSLHDIYKLPFIDKQLVKVCQDEMCIQKNKSKGLYITTGGSSGIPVGFYINKGITRAKELAFMEDQWSRIGYTHSDKCAVFRGGVVSSIYQGAISKIDYFRNWLILSSYHMTNENLPTYIELLNKFKPKFIQGYPSALNILAKFMKRNNIKFKFPLVGILAGSENLYQHQREIIKSVFQCPIYTWYGHSERLSLGGYCEKNDVFHMFPQYGYTEIIDKQDNIINKGIGEIVATGFHNSVMPLIRYKTGDIAQLSNTTPCACNRSYLLIQNIQGRSQEIIITKTDRKIIMTALNMHSNVFDNIIQFQFFQKKKGVLLFRYIPMSSFSSKDTDKIKKALLEKLGDDIELLLQSVDNIPLTKSGKHRFLIQELDIQ